MKLDNDKPEAIQEIAQAEKDAEKIAAAAIEAEKQEAEKLAASVAEGKAE